MLTVLTWLWGQKYTAAHVDRLRQQVAQHYGPHRFACVTNLPVDCEAIPDTEDFAQLKSPHGGAFPSCFRRLRLFHPEASKWFGERFVSLDLDMTITGDLRPLWDRPEDCVLLRDPLYPTQYNGSMLMLTAGARPQVWTEFDASSPAKALRAGKRGSDQGWLSYILPNEKTWGPEDGVYSYRKDVLGRRVPADARIVNYHGAIKPWNVRTA